ncbi:hypothetical protein [Streptomyces sp. NPDC060194]|uniref:hypothetical protein n=1 Tax=Streptomyces sp. NPDC060194 TaxID=3347069 RepID=UPI003661B3C0
MPTEETLAVPRPSRPVDPSPVREPRRPRITPYLAVGTLAWLLLTLAAWRIPMCCDFGQHAAVVERLKADLLDPSHPMADLPGAGSPYYSPYALLQGAAARLTDLPGWFVVRLSAPVNLLVLLTGLGRFTRTLTPRPWAPVAALVLMVLLWGTEMMWWSGFTGLMSLTGHLGYPSTFALGLTLHLWASTARAAGDGTGPWAYAGVGLLGGLTILVHPITSLGAAVGVVSLIVGHRAVRRPGWLVSLGAALLVAVCWPYFHVWELVGDSGVDAIHKALWTKLPEAVCLALVGVPVLAARWRRDRRDPLVLLFVLSCLVVAYGWASGHHTYGRLIGTALLAPQLALAVELTRPRPWPFARAVLAAVTAAAVGWSFLTVQGGAVVPRALDPVGLDQPPRWEEYHWAARHLRPGDVVLTNGYRAVRSLPGHGANLVAPVWPDPALDERERRVRRDAVRAYLAPDSTPAGRLAVARRYQVRWVLLGPRQRMPPEAVVVAGGPRSGELLARVPGVTRSR